MSWHLPHTLIVAPSTQTKKYTQKAPKSRPNNRPESPGSRLCSLGPFSAPKTAAFSPLERQTNTCRLGCCDADMHHEADAECKTQLQQALFGGLRGRAAGGDINDFLTHPDEPRPPKSAARAP